MYRHVLKVSMNFENQPSKDGWLCSICNTFYEEEDQANTCCIFKQGECRACKKHTVVSPQNLCPTCVEESDYRVRLRTWKGSPKALQGASPKIWATELNRVFDSAAELSEYMIDEDLEVEDVLPYWAEFHLISPIDLCEHYRAEMGDQLEDVPDIVWSDGEEILKDFICWSAIGRYYGTEIRVDPRLLGEERIDVRTEDTPPVRHCSPGGHHRRSD